MVAESNTGAEENPDNLYQLTWSYCSERTVQITGKNEVISKPVTKGCP